jgi:hypothetical protein
MKTHLFMAAAALVMLTSTAFASIGGIPHETRRAGDRLTVLTDDQGLMCKVPNVETGHMGKAVNGPNWERTAIYLDHIGQISCLPRTPVKG